jgi:hypothetical protein
MLVARDGGEMKKKKKSYPRYRIQRFNRLPGRVYLSIVPKDTPLWEILYIRSECHERRPYVLRRFTSFELARAAYIEEANEKRRLNAQT